MDAQGNSAFYQLGISPEDIDIIPANENFYGVDFSGQTLWGAAASGFSKIVGDILIAQESPGILYSVHWNGSAFEKTQLAQVPQWEHVTFAPAGLKEGSTVGATVPLNGTATDDGLPASSTLSTLWTKVSGPGTVAFNDANAPVTSAAFSVAGTYVLRLSASDTDLTSTDEVTLTVKPENLAPVVNAGPDKTVAFPASATLNGTVSDDGLPAGATLTSVWTKVSGPGTVSFGNPNAPATVASFSADGLYVLRLSASDSALSASDEVSITVNPRIQPPSVAINSPADGSIITGRTPVVGTVSEGTNWRLEYSLNDGEGSGIAPVWTAIAAGNTPVNNSLLATFDPTLLLNGTYAVRLVATDAAGQISIASFSAIVEGEQKIGNFSISFNDLGVPVAGLPIQVTRSYDSRDKRAGDLGVGWSLAVSNVRLEKNGIVGQNWEETRSGGFLPDYCAQQTKSHIVSVTFPGGKVYKFQPVINPRCQRVFPLQYANVTFAPMSGTHGTLVAEGSNDVYLAGSYPGTVDVLDLNTLSFYNPTVFHLTTEYLVDDNNPTGYAQVVEELRGASVRRVYTYGHDLISQSQLLSGVWTTSFYGYDGHGSVRAI